MDYMEWNQSNSMDFMNNSIPLECLDFGEEGDIDNIFRDEDLDLNDDQSSKDETSNIEVYWFDSDNLAQVLTTYGVDLEEEKDIICNQLDIENKNSLNHLNNSSTNLNVDNLQHDSLDSHFVGSSVVNEQESLLTCLSSSELDLTKCLPSEDLQLLNNSLPAVELDSSILPSTQFNLNGCISNKKSDINECHKDVVFKIPRDLSEKSNGKIHSVPIKGKENSNHNLKSNLTNMHFSNSSSDRSSDFQNKKDLKKHKRLEKDKSKKRLEHLKLNGNFQAQTPSKVLKKTKKGLQRQVKDEDSKSSNSKFNNLNKSNKRCVKLEQPGFKTGKRKLHNSTICYGECKDKRLFSEDCPQPHHLKFSKPQNTALWKIRNLNDSHQAGYNTYRGDFEIESDNNVEEMLCLAGELSNCNSFNKANKSSKAKEEKKLFESLQIALVEGYNLRLRERKEKKRIIKEHGLINQRDTCLSFTRMETALGKANAKKLVKFSRLLKANEAKSLLTSLVSLNEKRANTNKIIFSRTQHGITSKVGLEVFESERKKRVPQTERFDVRNLAVPPTVKKRKASVDIFHMPRFMELSPKEADLCTLNGLTPQFFLDTKNLLMADCKKNNGLLLKKARKLVKIDVNKTRKIFDLLMEQGHVWPPENVNK